MSVDIVSRKYDGKLHRRWRYEPLVLEADRWVLWMQEDRTVTESDGSTWVPHAASIGFFWPARWYNVVAIFNPERGFRYYCNVAQPPTLTDGAAGTTATDPKASTLTYIDLDLDVVVAGDGRVRVADEDEFARNRRRYGYPPDVVTGARRGLEALRELAERRQGPFAPAELYRWAVPLEAKDGFPALASVAGLPPRPPAAQ